MKYANLGHVPFEVTLEVLEEYQQMVTAQEFIAVGGQDVADRLLVKAFGENGAEACWSGWRNRTNPIRRVALKKADPQQLARFLEGERAQTKALVLGHLEAKQASAVLMKLEPEVPRRLRTASREPWAILSGCCGQGVRGTESPAELRGRSESIGRFRIQRTLQS